jgi:Flp pilus assembly protein TadG
LKEQQTMRLRRLRLPRLSRGKVLVLTAFLMPVIVGGLALSVDTAIVAEGRAQLQTVADAAALAGALQLADNNRVTGTNNINPEMNAAQAMAVAIGQKNLVLTDVPVFQTNNGNSPNGDIVIGYLSTTDYTSPAPDTTASHSTFNSVMVNASRDSKHGGAIPGFFGNFLGISQSSLSVSAVATVQNYVINGVTTIGGGNAALLPIVLDINTYNAMLSGDPTQTTDMFTWNPSTGTVTPGADGIYESNLYPVGTDPGNWGTVQMGVSFNSTSTLAAQIMYGITPAQLANYPNSTIALDYSQTPPQITFIGNPGISAGLQAALTSIIGKPVMIPIYDQTGAEGSNAYYRCIAFAGVRILSVNFQGNPKFVIIQPSLINDVSAIPGSAQTSWTAGGVIRLHLTR